MSVDNVRRFDTGAVRSKDADKTRYDLITPIGLRELAGFYGVREIHPETTIDECLGGALSCIYEFLGGYNDAALLAAVAAHIAEAIAIENDEDRAWILGTSPISDPDSEGYPFERIPTSFLRVIAETCHEGAAKYSDYNWEKGMPVHDLLNHVIKHINDYRAGKRDEPDLAHAGWGALAAIHSLEMWPELNEGTLRGPGCVPPSESAKHDAADGEDEGGDYLYPSAQELPDPFLATAMEKTVAEFPNLFSTFAELFPALKQVAKLRYHRIPVIADFQRSGANPPVLYLSGPMSGIEDFNFPAFDAAASQLRAKGYRVLNPADFGADPRISWEDCLSRDLFMLGHAQILVRLPGWEASRGATLEHNTAVSLSKGVVDLAELV